MTTFLIYTLVLVLLGIFVRIFWKPLLIMGSIFFIAGGIALSSAVTAVCFQFFSLMTSGLSDWGSFYTYFTYSLVFFTVGIVVYGCIVYDMASLAIDFVKELFGK
jgi:hypothetical protein